MLFKRYKKKIIIIKSCLILSFFILSSTSSIVSSYTKYERNCSSFNEGYIDITVTQAYELLNTTHNGIQIPIDVRTDSEWIGERINTSYPEDPRHHCLYDWDDPPVLQEFIEQYNGKEIILYCYSGSRSTQAAEILVENNFDGIIYNMQGGISQWKSSGLPTKKGNTIPNAPSIFGPTKCIVGNPYNYNAKAIDPDFDAVRYGWDFNDDKSVDEWTEYNFSNTLQNITHIWYETGSYTISVIAEDRVGYQSSAWTSLTVLVIYDDKIDPVVNIIKPGKYLYFKNEQVLPFFNTFIIGNIDIIIHSSDYQSGLDYVELYINNERVSNTTDEDFIFNWDESVFGKFIIKAIAYDKAGNTADDSIYVWKFF